MTQSGLVALLFKTFEAVIQTYLKTKVNATSNLKLSLEARFRCHQGPYLKVCSCCLSLLICDLQSCYMSLASTELSVYQMSLCLPLGLPPFVSIFASASVVPDPHLSKEY